MYGSLFRTLQMLLRKITKYKQIITQYPKINFSDKILILLDCKPYAPRMHIIHVY